MRFIFLYKDIKYFSTKKGNNEIMNALIGDLLGDGHIRFHNKKAKNVRMEFTFSTKKFSLFTLFKICNIFRIMYSK